MFDDEDLNADGEPFDLDWQVALAELRAALGRMVGRSRNMLIPPVTRMAGDRWQRPRLSEDEVSQIMVAVGQARLAQQHDTYIVWEMMQTIRRD
jgi:hypothetical protein